MKKKEFYTAPDLEQLEFASEKAILEASFSDQNTETMPVEEEEDF